MRRWIAAYGVVLVYPALVIAALTWLAVDRAHHRTTVEYNGAQVDAFVYHESQAVTLRESVDWPSEVTIEERDGRIVAWRTFGTPRRGVLRFERPATHAQQHLWRALFARRVSA